MKQVSRWKIIFIITICILSICFSLPSFIKKENLSFLPEFIRDKSVNLGLDLRGGSHLLLEVDFNSYLNDQYDLLRDSLKQELRKSKIIVKNIKVDQLKIHLSFLNEESIITAKKIIKANFKYVLIKEHNDDLIISYNDAYITELQQSLMQQSMEIIRRRVDETGTREPIIQRQGMSNILLQVPGMENPNHLKNLLGKTAKLSFHLVNSKAMENASNIKKYHDSTIFESDHNPDMKFSIYNKILLTGDSLTDARVQFDEFSRPIVSFKFNSFGAKKFAEITRKHSGEALAIILDNKVISAPRIDEPIIGGSGVIRGSFTSVEANDLALLLRAGSLPAPLKIIEERTVGPSLGVESINAGTKAAIIGTIAVMFFILLFYGVFGIFANIALLLNLIFIIAILALLQATLTLPGIAGIVLTMGMAVDANVLIFERIREEAKLKTSTMSTIERGFEQAYSTIIDSNITTIFATLILYFFGSGVVKGFAVTLMIGVICSMFSAITITKMLIQIFMHKRNRKYNQLL
jgi:preprotein translocase subunit SecD